MTINPTVIMLLVILGIQLYAVIYTSWKDDWNSIFALLLMYIGAGLTAVLIVGFIGEKPFVYTEGWLVLLTIIIFVSDMLWTSSQTTPSIAPYTLSTLAYTSLLISILYQHFSTRTYDPKRIWNNLVVPLKQWWRDWNDEDEWNKIVSSVKQIG